MFVIHAFLMFGLGAPGMYCTKHRNLPRNWSPAGGAVDVDVLLENRDIGHYWTLSPCKGQT